MTDLVLAVTCSWKGNRGPGGEYCQLLPRNRRSAPALLSFGTTVPREPFTVPVAPCDLAGTDSVGFATQPGGCSTAIWLSNLQSNVCHGAGSKRQTDALSPLWSVYFCHSIKLDWRSVRCFEGYLHVASVGRLVGLRFNGTFNTN